MGKQGLPTSSLCFLLVFRLVLGVFFRMELFVFETKKRRSCCFWSGMVLCFSGSQGNFSVYESVERAFKVRNRVSCFLFYAERCVHKQTGIWVPGRSPDG